VEASWSAKSTKINETGFDTVKSQQGYATLFQIAANITVSILYGRALHPDHGLQVLHSPIDVCDLMQLRENWINDMRIYPESAPVWARLPLGNLTGYAAYMEVRFVLDDGSSGTWICLT
jgi:hypothetical protein